MKYSVCNMKNGHLHQNGVKYIPMEVILFISMPDRFHKILSMSYLWYMFYLMIYLMKKTQ